MFNTDENDDSEILKSIEYAEAKLGKKMPTPHKVYTSKNAPVKYDVEMDNVKSKINTKLIQGTQTTDAEKEFSGECDIGDNQCMQKSRETMPRPADETNLHLAKDETKAKKEEKPTKIKKEVEKKEGEEKVEEKESTPQDK